MKFCFLLLLRFKMNCVEKVPFLLKKTKHKIITTQCCYFERLYNTRICGTPVTEHTFSGMYWIEFAVDFLKITCPTALRSIYSHTAREPFAHASYDPFILIIVIFELLHEWYVSSTVPLLFMWEINSMYGLNGFQMRDIYWGCPP